MVVEGVVEEVVEGVVGGSANGSVVGGPDIVSVTIRAGAARGFIVVSEPGAVEPEPEPEPVPATVEDTAGTVVAGTRSDAGALRQTHMTIAMSPATTPRNSTTRRLTGLGFRTRPDDRPVRGRRFPTGRPEVSVGFVSGLDTDGVAVVVVVAASR